MIEKHSANYFFQSFLWNSSSELCHSFPRTGVLGYYQFYLRERSNPSGLPGVHIAAMPADSHLRGNDGVKKFTKAARRIGRWKMANPVAPRRSSFFPELCHSGESRKPLKSSTFNKKSRRDI
jgi:hypothetical protein